MLTAIKLYALASLLFTALYAAWGYRWNKRKAIKAEYRFWSSRVIEHDLSELPPIIRTWQ
jgi:hypothetical protein